MTCPAMFVNGCQTGITRCIIPAVPETIPKDLLPVVLGYVAAAIGATVRGTSVFQAGKTAIRRPRTATSVFGLLLPTSSCFLDSEFLFSEVFYVGA